MVELDQKDKKDLEDFLKLYRTLKNTGKFFIWLLGIAFLIVSIWIACKELFKK